MPEKVSAGLLLFRRGSGEVEVLLAHPGGPFYRQKDDGFWTVPKGEIEGTEDLIDRARVEFREELGIDPPPGPFIGLGSIVQKGGKRVHAWACEGDFAGPVSSNTFRMEWPPKSGKLEDFPEVDRAEWFNLEKARLKINPAQIPFLDAVSNIPSLSTIIDLSKNEPKGFKDP